MPDAAPPGRANATGLDPDAIPADWEEFDRYARPRLRPLLARFCASGVVDPEDALQEALIRAQRQFGDALASVRTMLAWVSTTGIREAVRLGRYGFAAHERPHGGASEVAALAAAASLDGEAETVDRLLAAEALGTLSVEDQHVLLLDGVGFSGRELARYLGVGENTARARLARARKRFKKAAGTAIPSAVPAWLRRRRWSGDYDGTAIAAAHTTAAASLALSLLTIAAPVPGVPGPGNQAHAVPRRAELQASGAHAVGPRLARTHVGGPVARQVTTADPDAAGGRTWRGPVPRTPLPTCLGFCTLQSRPDGWRGDRLRVRRLGEDSPGVEQWVTPACARTPDNAVAQCEAGEESEEFIVKQLPPSPPPGGTA